MTGRKEYEIKGIYAAVVAIFAVFLAVPVIRLLMESFMADAGVSVRNYAQVLTERGFAAALANSVKVSVSSALIATAWPSSLHTQFSIQECRENLRA